jgi:DNA-binding helix-hairpin-helix protein with protein kinase domain
MGLATTTKTVRTTAGEDLGLRQRIAMGGQGTIWLAHDGKRVVKLYHDRVVRQAGDQAVRHRLRELNGLPLEGLAVARPLALLAQPDYGYVAEFFPERETIGALLKPSPTSDPASWWHESGGLRRRLRLLAGLAETLKTIHSRGLTYGDLSESNVLIRSDAASAEAVLIDVDNVTHHGRNGCAIQTPWFGAPEVVRGEVKTSAVTDAWSFAVLVAWCLQLEHPFTGMATHESEARQVAALEGRLAWADDVNDDTNRRTVGLTPDVVMSKRIYGLLQRTFGKRGRVEPASRPALFEWTDALHRASDRTIDCRVCGLSTFDALVRCPWCQSPRRRHARLNLHRWLPGRRPAYEPTSCYGVSFDVTPGAEYTLTRRVTHGATGPRMNEPVVVMRVVKRGFEVRAAAAAAEPVRLRRPSDGDSHLLGTDFVPFVASEHHLHFGALDAPHRLGALTIVEGG